jgi:AcrR family transcriptional regulator
MARWEPDARDRLQAAAMSLFEERGYARTTVGEIAARAGLTERTFFRYFTDKREVLFSGGEKLEALVVGAIAAAPEDLAPLDVVALALEAPSPWFDDRRAHARKRQALIVAHAELHERELIKMRKLAAAIARALEARGVAAEAARLAAEMGITAFVHAFERWVSAPARAKPTTLAAHVQTVLAEMRALVSPTPIARSKKR